MAGNVVSAQAANGDGSGRKAKLPSRATEIPVSKNPNQAILFSDQGVESAYLASVKTVVGRDRPELVVRTKPVGTDGGEGRLTEDAILNTGPTSVAQHDSLR